MKKVYLSISSIFLMASCGTMGLVSAPTDYKGGGEEVTARKSSMNFFMLLPMNTHKQTQILLNELDQKCTKGVTNIRATTSNRSIFIFTSEILEISGNCK